MYFPRMLHPFIKFALGENVKQSNWSGSVDFHKQGWVLSKFLLTTLIEQKNMQITWEEYNSLSPKTESKVCYKT